jgi:hypothetical protein
METDNLFEQYIKLREKRLQIQHEADSLEQQEKDILYLITKDFDLKHVGYSAQQGNWKMNAKRLEVPSCVDWDKTLKYIKETGELDLLHKRLTETAVKARWDSGVEIPGIDHAYKWKVVIEPTAGDQA